MGWGQYRYPPGHPRYCKPHTSAKAKGHLAAGPGGYFRPKPKNLLPRIEPAGNFLDLINLYKVAGFYIIVAGEPYPALDALIDFANVILKSFER